MERSLSVSVFHPNTHLGSYTRKTRSFFSKFSKFSPTNKLCCPIPCSTSSSEPLAAEQDLAVQPSPAAPSSTGKCQLSSSCSVSISVQSCFPASSLPFQTAVARRTWVAWPRQHAVNYTLFIPGAQLSLYLPCPPPCHTLCFSSLHTCYLPHMNTPSYETESRIWGII